MLPRVYYFEGQDKVVHMVLFSVWCFMCYQTSSSLSKRFLITVLAIAVLVAFLTEFLQNFVPRRRADWLDGIFDVLGIAIGLLTGFFTKKELLRAGKKFDS